MVIGLYAINRPILSLIQMKFSISLVHRAQRKGISNILLCCHGNQVSIIVLVQVENFDPVELIYPK